MTKIQSKPSLMRLLNPRSIAVVGASPKGGRGGRCLVNLKDTGFDGEIFAVNPRYHEVLGFPCFPSLDSLPAVVDCALMAVEAETSCNLLESAFELGITAAVVLAAGFGEGGQNENRALRLRELGARGMSICGPNCYGLLSIKRETVSAAFSGRLPSPLRSGGVALVSQSGGLASNAFTPLMADRRLGFRYLVSCGNQLATSIEEYVAAFAEDPDVSVIAAIVESLSDPSRLLAASREAHLRKKPIVFFQVGRSAKGREMARSHTGALVADSDIVGAFLRRCGIVCVEDYDRFIEAIELFAVAPADRKSSKEVVVVSGSGGAAAIVADEAEACDLTLPPFERSVERAICDALPGFGRVSNPLDGTGAMSDDPTVLGSVLDAIASADCDSMICGVVSAKAASPKEHRFSEMIAKTAQRTDRLVAAFQYSPLGGPLDAVIVDRLHEAGVPLILGAATAIRVLRYFPMAHDLRRKALASAQLGQVGARSAGKARLGPGFLKARAALLSAGLNVVRAEMARSEAEAVAIFERFGVPIALKAEAPGLLHKSDIGCVRLGCSTRQEVTEGYRTIERRARDAGCSELEGVLVQPMIGGIAEVYAGVKFDPRFGPAVCFGLGGIFVEILKEITIECAPLTHEIALDMVRRVKGSELLFGARGRPRADVDALTDFLVKLSEFAVENHGACRAIDLNPVIIGEVGQGAVAVDIAIEANDGDGSIRS